MTDPDEQRASAELLAMETWLGRAISDFSRVEKALGDLYQHCFWRRDMSLAMHCYFAVKDSSTRQKMTARAVYFSLSYVGNPGDQVERWNALRNRVEELSRDRNRLAHGEVRATKSAEYHDNYQVFLTPYAHIEPYASAATNHFISKTSEGRAPSGVFQGEQRRFTLDDIKNFTVCCEELSREIYDFRKHLVSLLSKSRPKEN